MCLGGQRCALRAYPKKLTEPGSQSVELELSQQPELRRVQVDLLDRMLGLLERRHLDRRVMPWETIAQAAESSMVAAATDARLATLPPSDRFESFDELAAQRDEAGMVRLPSRR